MFLKGLNQTKSNLNPEMDEHELGKRIFEDNLTGDPFKQAFEAKRNTVNGSQIKSRQQYFDNNNKIENSILDQFTGDPFKESFRKKEEVRQQTNS